MNYESRIMKYIFSILLIFIYSLFIVQPAYAQTTSFTPLPANISQTSPIYTDLIINNLFHSISCIGTGQSVIGQPCLSYQTLTDAQGIIKKVPMLSQSDLSGGILGTTNKLLVGLYLNPPIHTGTYLASIGQDMGMIKQAQAQGVTGSGSDFLNPILNLWRVSRNISYLFMIIIFVVIGIMVMFRKKLNPQTVITAQSSLPGLVIGLILITFSYFLASLVTDVAFIGTDIVGFYFSQAKPDISVPDATSLTSRTTNANAVSIFSEFINKQQSSDYQEAADVIMKYFDTGPANTNSWLIPSPKTIITMAAAFINQQYAQLVGPIGSAGSNGVCLIAGFWIGSAKTSECIKLAEAVVSSVTSGSLAGIGLLNQSGSIGTALYIAAIVTLIFSMIKLIIRLIQNYLSIIFLTITAPFTFLLSSLPGRQGMATNWIMNMLSNILAFPAVFAVLYFIAYIFGPESQTTSNIFGIKETFALQTEEIFGIKNSLTTGGTQTLPLLGGLSTSLIKTLLSFVALISLPTIPDIVSKTIGKFGEAGAMIERAYSQASGQGQGYMRQAQGNADSSFKNIMGVKQGFMPPTSINPTTGAQVVGKSPAQILFGKETSGTNSANPS